MAKNILSTTIQQQDDNGNVLARSVDVFSDDAPTAGDFRGLGLLADTSQHAITLPVTQALQVALKNTHASAKITVTWTPNGGVEATILILGPGDGIMFWHENTGTSYGVSSLKLTSDTANATYKLFIGG